jgi:2'-5' RNA ligase
LPRLFTGIEIPLQIAQGLSMLRGGLPGARWIDPENYHLTLRFIGDVEGHVGRDVMQMLADVRRTSFQIVLDRLDQFGGKKPRETSRRFCGRKPDAATPRAAGGA